MQLKGDTLAFSGSLKGGTDQGVDGSVASIRHALGQENLNELKLEVAIAQIRPHHANDQSLACKREA